MSKPTTSHVLKAPIQQQTGLLVYWAPQNVQFQGTPSQLRSTRNSALDSEAYVNVSCSRTEKKAALLTSSQSCNLPVQIQTSFFSAAANCETCNRGTHLKGFQALGLRCDPFLAAPKCWSVSSWMASRPATTWSIEGRRSMSCWQKYK